MNVMKTITAQLQSTQSRAAALVLALVLVLTFATLAGCAASQPQAEEKAATEPIQVTDQRGVSHEFDGPVERAVTIVMPAASLFVAVDGGVDHLVGMNPASKTALVDGVLGDFFPEAEQISDEVSGTDFVPNVEAVLELEPDVVIQWGDRGDELTGPLEQAGIPVVGLTYGTQEDLEEWVKIFGAILGKEDRAEQMIKTFDHDASFVTAAVKEAEAKPKIMSLTTSEGSFSTANASSYTNYYIELAGGINVAAGLAAASDVSIEQILKWDPEIVLLGNFDNTSPQDLYDDPLWQDVAAVKKGQVYQMPLGGYRWDPPNQESGLTFRWVAQLAHPEADLGDLRAQIGSEYEFLYGVQPTESQLDQILNLDDNANSANYHVFAS